MIFVSVGVFGARWMIRFASSRESLAKSGLSWGKAKRSELNSDARPLVSPSLSSSVIFDQRCPQIKTSMQNLLAYS